jgi:3-hydroxy-D-aspartate aldolase
MAARVACDFGVELDALVEIEVGMQRCGVAPGAPAKELAGRIAESPGLRFRGLQAYQGAAQHLPTWEERERAIESAAQSVRTTLEALDRAGIDCDIVGGAGTGTYAFEGASGVWNELQVGSFIFMDVEYGRIFGRNGGRYTDFEHSLFVLATVLSAPSAERAVLDAGLKSYSAEQGMPWVHGRPDLEVYGIADEHSKVKLGAESARLKLGDKLMLIPSHCDPTVNLHDWYVGVRNGRVQALWPITARGASS